MTPNDIIREAEPLIEWYTINLTRGQLEWIELLCRFHLDLSKNDHAKQKTSKLMYCLSRWPKKVKEQEKRIEELEKSVPYDEKDLMLAFFHVFSAEIDTGLGPVNQAEKWAEWKSEFDADRARQALKEDTK